MFANYLDKNNIYFDNFTGPPKISEGYFRYVWCIFDMFTFNANIFKDNLNSLKFFNIIFKLSNNFKV